MVEHRGSSGRGAAAPLPYESWRTDKPAVRSRRGIVAAQDLEAARIGADILAGGGNAVDAAIATAFALSVTEPWMSGLGGGGFMILYSARDRRVHVVDYAMVAPSGLDPADYPIGEGRSADLFGWPSVAGDRNVHGPHSIAVPGSAAGYALALERFGSLGWAEVIAPAIALAERGHRVTWWTTLQVAAEAAILARDPGARAVWLPGGHAPLMSGDPEPVFLAMGAYAETLRVLAAEGPGALYGGALGRSLAVDIQAAGGCLSVEDLAAYRARLTAPLTRERAGVTLHLPGGLTAGPTFVDALDRMPPPSGGALGAAAYADFARALLAAYRHRLATMGHAGDRGSGEGRDDRGCTTHLCAVDAEGNMVALTSTLLSRFGSRMVAPGTGILMNNGIYWFDPRPGRPNSIAAGQRPLTNMCPLVATRDGSPAWALGASGGRKIMPAVFQLNAFLAEHGMAMGEAFARPRIDVGDIDRIIADDRLDGETLAALGELAPTVAWPPTAHPAIYATPTGVGFDETGACIGAANPYAPLVTAVPA